MARVKQEEEKCMNVDGMKILSISKNKEELLLIEGYARSLSLESEGFHDPDEAFASSKNTAYDLIIVDYETPQPNAVDFIKSFRQNISRTVPIIILLATEEGQEIQVKALHAGAHDFLMRPLHTSLFQSRVFNTLKLKKAQSLLDGELSLLEEEVKNATEGLKQNEHEALKMLALAAEYKEHESGGHILRVSHYCKLLAKATGLNEKIQDVIFHASALHDLGKVGVSQNILCKPKTLEEDEVELMKHHARLGYDLLKYAKSEYLKAGAVISYSHHERFDGSGYPIGLSGDTIPLPGRIVAIADAFDAMTTKRAYKEQVSIEDACTVLKEEKGKHFDPDLVDLFLQNMDEVRSIISRFPDEA